MENRDTSRAQNPPRAGRKTIEDGDVGEDNVTQDASETPGVENESDLSMGGDTGFDRVVGADEAGLGGGLDQAEEARLGVTDEELAEMLRRRRKPNE